jgi:N-[(2S)-2-amino-2-carboxyethyl]-L-glutamate dehydrogenase
MSDLAVVTGATVRRILDGQEDLVLNAIQDAYVAHGMGQTRCPGTQPLFANGGRFFAMPGSLGNGSPIVGLKWVASFAGNIATGAERASALLIANDAHTGLPIAIVDGTLISAKRTAASAAVTLRALAVSSSIESIALVGCGPINYEIFRFVAHLFRVHRVLLVDLQPARAESFRRRLENEIPGITAVAARLDEALQTADVVSIATNATVPHIAEVPQRPFIILHISLRDLAPSIIVRCDNIVDDIEHVCTANTSIHLAAQESGHRDFIRATIPGLLSGAKTYRPGNVPTVVSPFGLAILDLAVLREVLARVDNDAESICVSGFGESVWH